MKFGQKYFNDLARGVDPARAARRQLDRERREREEAARGERAERARGGRR